jgi:hypothetical protein
MRIWWLWILTSAVLANAQARADSTSVWTGNLRVGGVIEDEDGDRSVMQETFNIHEGFGITKINLNGRFNRNTSLYFDADNLTFDGRRATLDLRQAGIARLRSRYDESLFIYDPSGSLDATRRDWWSSLSLTPRKWLWFSGDYDLQTRSGDRVGYPDGVQSALGTSYETDLNRWRVDAQARSASGIGGTFAYDGVSFTDALDSRNDRDGSVFSAIVHIPGVFIKRLTHVVRGSVGKSELPTAGIAYDMATVQYTGILVPWRPMRLKYRFYGMTVDDDATAMQTDRWINDVDADYRWRQALFAAGYGWEAWDDDRSVTTYENWRGAITVNHPDQKYSGRVAYAQRNSGDEEDQTLLKDTEYARAEVRLDARPSAAWSLGGRVADRQRKMPDIGAEAEGLAASAYARYTYEHSAESGKIASTVSADYQYADDDYDNRVGEYQVESQFITGSIEVDYHEMISATAAVHYLDIGGDLDIEKSILSFELDCTFRKAFDARVKYNVYNYDDYLAADYLGDSGYYTANVVWIDVGYAFSTE